MVVDLLQSCTSYPVGGPGGSIHYPVSLRAVLVTLKLPGAFSPIERQVFHSKLYSITSF